MKYLVIIEKTATGFSAYSPDVEGGIATATTIAELKQNMQMVKILELNQSIPRIENFLGLTPGNLPRDMKINVRKKQDKYNLLSQIDKDFLEEKVNTHCKELRDRFFPEITNSEVEAWRESISAN